MLRLLLPWCFFGVAYAFYPSHLPIVFPSRLTTARAIFSTASNEARASNELVAIDQQTEKKPFRRKKSYIDENKLLWLRQATENFLELYGTVGTLPEGKWHEAISLFNAWSNYQKDLGCNAAYQMESILNVLSSERIHTGNSNINITIHTYNKLMDAWACSALFNTIPNPLQASQRIYEILVTLQENFQTSTYSTIPLRTILLANNVTLESVPTILPMKPNSESFHIALHAVCKVEGVFVARRLLAYMEHLYRSDKNECAQPTQSQYLQILDAYARFNSYQSSTLAEAFLRHLKYNYDNNSALRTRDGSTMPILPNTLCYNIVIRAWSRYRRGRESAEHADRLLEEMKESQSEHCRPDIFTYGCTSYHLNCTVLTVKLTFRSLVIF